MTDALPEQLAAGTTASRPEHVNGRSRQAVCPNHLAADQLHDFHQAGQPCHLHALGCRGWGPSMPDAGIQTAPTRAISSCSSSGSNMFRVQGDAAASAACDSRARRPLHSFACEPAVTSVCVLGFCCCANVSPYASAVAAPTTLSSARYLQQDRCMLIRKRCHSQGAACSSRVRVVIGGPPQEPAPTPCSHAGGQTQ